MGVYNLVEPDLGWAEHSLGLGVYSLGVYNLGSTVWGSTVWGSTIWRSTVWFDLEAETRYIAMFGRSLFLRTGMKRHEYFSAKFGNGRRVASIAGENWPVRPDLGCGGLSPVLEKLYSTLKCASCLRNIYIYTYIHECEVLRVHARSEAKQREL